MYKGCKIINNIASKVEMSERDTLRCTSNSKLCWMYIWYITSFLHEHLITSVGENIKKLFSFSRGSFSGGLALMIVINNKVQDIYVTSVSSVCNIVSAVSYYSR